MGRGDNGVRKNKKNMFEIKKLKTEQSWLKERQQIITASEMAFALANFCDDETTRLFYEDILNKVAAPGKPKSRYAFYISASLYNLIY